MRSNIASGVLAVVVLASLAGGPALAMAKRPQLAPEAGGPLDLPTQIATVKGLKIAYTDSGTGDVLVFIHGFPLNRHLWDAQVRDLSVDHRVIALDLPGFGDSQARKGTVAMAALADDLRALLLQLKVERPILIGHSMGGFVSLAYAERYSQALRGLVLVSSDADASTEAGATDDRALAQLVREKGVGPAIEAFVPLMGPARGKDPGLDRQARALMATASVDGIAGSLVGMAERPSRHFWLQTSRLPALVLVGTADQAIAPEASQRIAAAMVNAKLIELENAGHLLPLERPVPVNSAIRHFAKTSLR